MLCSQRYVFIFSSSTPPGDLDTSYVDNLLYFIILKSTKFYYPSALVEYPCIFFSFDFISRLC